MISLTYHRTFYSEDWCREHPEGTVGEFNRDFATLDANLLKASLFVLLNKESTNMFLAI
jgi:hypothetical protein